MKHDHFDIKPLRNVREKSQQRSNSSNQLAKRLYRNNSLTRLVPLTSSMSASLNTSLIPSVSLRKLAKLEHSQPSLQISQGRIYMRKSEDLPFLTQQSTLLKKKGVQRKFQKIENLTEKNIIPQQLKADRSLMETQEEKNSHFRPSKKWLLKLKQGRESHLEKLTPEDFIRLVEEEGGLSNEFVYLQKGAHPYDLRIVQFAGVTADQYITISARGVTYFNWEGSRFVTLEEWRHEAALFNRLMQLQFFGKYKLHKNFSNWKKYFRKIAMKKTMDKLKTQMLVHDRHLRQALLSTRGLCCRMQSEINYCYLDDSVSALPFAKFKAAQDNYLTEKFQKRMNELQDEIKSQVAQSLGVSMHEFKEDNKISSGKEGKGLPLLIGDQKNLDMPYTKEATLRVQQQKFKRFLKLVDFLVVHSKINMMEEATHSTAHKLQEENDSYVQFLAAQQKRTVKTMAHFKGKQYIECELQLSESDECVLLKPSRDELIHLMEDIVNRSTMKLVRNHHRIINNPDINAILYEGTEEQPNETDPINTLKAILGVEEKQEAMARVLTQAINISYSFLEKYAATLAPLVAQYFCNQGQFAKISSLTSQDFFNIREWMQKWRKELQQNNKIHEEYESAVFLLNFRAVKEITCQCTNLCLAKFKETVPKILESALRREEEQLRQALRLIEVTPVGIEVFITFQHNKNTITAQLDQYQDTLAQIGQLIDILKELGGVGESTVARSIKEKKQLGEMIKLLKARIEQAEMQSKGHECYAQQQVKKMIPKISYSLGSLYALSKQPRSGASIMIERIAEWQLQFETINNEAGKLREYQRFLMMEQLNEEELNKFWQYFKTYKHVWVFCQQIEAYQTAFLATSWKTLLLEDIKLKIDAFLEESQAIKKSVGIVNRDEKYQIEEHDINAVDLVVIDIRNRLKPILEVVECLRDPSLEERQQKFIRSDLQKRFKFRLSELIGEHEGVVSELINEGLIQELDFLKMVVFKSKKQIELNSKMTAVSRFWNDSVGHSSKSLIDNFEQHYWVIAAEIDDKIRVINSVCEDHEVEDGEFRIRVETEKGMFDSLRVLLFEWRKHQNFLIYLEPIFANVYWKGTSEFKIYSYAESNWKKLTKQISKDVSLRKLASQEKRHLSVLLQNNAIFAELSGAVDLFLNAKREAFPKFYFMANEQLLQLLLQDKDYSSIDRHLSCIFPNLKSLELNEERNCPLGVRSMADEFLPFRASPVKQVLELQEGLRIIEERMKESVRSGLLKCSNYYMQDDFNRKLWISENILQVLLFIGNAEFTKLLEYDYLQPDGDEMSQLLAFQLTQNKELAALSKEAGMAQMNSFYKLAVLLMQGNHFRDIIQRLQQMNVQDENSYEWQREIRSYYNGSEVAYTRYLTKSVDYGYEFMCPNYSYSLSTLSERYFIELANTAGLHYLPVLVTRAHLVSHFCNSNARNYFTVALHPNLSHAYVNNLCQGALSSNSYLELTDAQFINEQVASLICSFMHQAKSILERREVFHISSTGKNGLTMPTFNIFLRMGELGDLKPLQSHLKVNYRIINVPQIPISAYLQFTITLLFDSIDTDFPKRVQKACEIVNKCSGFTVFCTEQIRGMVLRSACPVLTDFKTNIFEELVKRLYVSVGEQEQLRFLESILRQVILQESSEEIIRTKPKPERDCRNLSGLIRQVLSRKRVCLIAGPSSSGKQHFILQAYVGAGITPAEVFYTDLLSGEELLGRFDGQLWKEGVLQQSVKRLSNSQQEWLVFEGKLTASTEILIHGIVRGQLRLFNGEMLYLKPNWKFIFSTDYLPQTVCLPPDLYIVANQNFVPSDDQLQYLLQNTVSRFFKSNNEGFSILKNLCLNNFQKVLKFRLKGRFLKAEHLLRSFVNILQSVLSRCPQRLLQQRGNHVAIEKLFLWCIYWTVYSSLSFDNGKKFESQLFEQVKMQTDRSLPLSLSRFEMDNPLGSLKRVEVPPTTSVQGLPYYLNGHFQAIAKCVQLLLSNNKSVLLLGQNNCGKSTFLTYLKQSLGEQNYSFLMVRLSKEMKSETFNELLYRKAKIVISPSKQKYLSANNGKKLILIIDDINLLREQSYIGRFLKSLLALGYYYDHDTLEKIYLSNITILAAENSSYEFDLSYELVKYFKPVCLPPLSIRDIIPLHKEFISPQYSAHICHSVASLHEFVSACGQKADVHFPISIDIPLRILNTLKEYSGKQKIVKIWEYVSIQEYVFGFPSNRSSRNKIVAEIKNYSNLMLQDSQQDPNPIDNYQNIIGQLIRKYPQIEIDNSHNDYYLYVTMILQLTKSPNLFTVKEPLCPSLKQEILSDLCLQNSIELIHPFKSGNIKQKTKGLSKDARLAVYASDSDHNFEQIINCIMNEESANLIYFIDFSNEQVWRSTIDKFPSLCHFGSKYIKDKVADSKKYPEGSLKRQMQSWIELFKEKGQNIQGYAKQEIQRIIPRNFEKIGQNMRREMNKNDRLRSSSESIQTKISNLKKEIENNKNELQEMVKSEELKRKQLVSLKNNYKNEETEAQRIMRNSYIQVIQSHLNEAMVKKRANQDYTRTKQDECNIHLKIIHILTNILARTQQTYSILKRIEQNLNKIAVFLSITEYFLAQDSKVETQVLQSLSSTLPVKFDDLMEQIFGCRVKIHEEDLVFWALSNKSCILQSSSDGLANQIEKRCRNTKVIKSVRQLQEIDQFNANENYIIFGQMRSETKFSNDMMALNADKENKERIKNKQEVKDFKEDRSIKDSKQEKADYDRNIYFIVKDKEKQKDEKLKDKNSKDGIETMNRTFSKESKQDLLISGRRADRKMTRMNSIMRATLFGSSGFLKKEESSSFKQKPAVSHLKQQLVVSIKRRQVKQGDLFSKTEAQLHEFMTVHLQNEVFYKGGKVITKACGKYESRILNLTLICKPLKKQDSRQQIRSFKQISQDISLNFLEELLQSVDPISLGVIRSLKQELQRLVVQVAHQQKIITDKMLQKSVKSLADIGKKDGDFMETLYDNMKVVETKLQQTLSNRQKPYLAYFKLCTVLWKYVSNLIQLYPLFRMTKRQMHDIILANIKYNDSIEIDGHITEPIEKIDEKVSQSQLTKALIQYVVSCLGTREGREALCLLAMSLQIHRGSVSQLFLMAFIRIIQKKIDTVFLEQVRSLKNECSKQLGKLIQSYISGSGDFIKHSHRYISKVLQFDFQQSCQTIKSGWLNLKQSFIAIALLGTDPFGSLSEMKNCLMTKQHSDHSKCLEIMVDKGLSRLVLVNFIKKESYSRILAQFEEWPKEVRYHLVFLFTGEEFFRKCQFIHRLAECRIIKVQNWKSPQKQLISAIQRNFREPPQPEFEKVLKLVLYNQILVFFKQKLEGYRQDLVVANSCFFASDFLHALVAEMSILDSKKLLDIACDTVLRGKEKWFVRESRKFLRKDQGDLLCKTFLGDATPFVQQQNSELSYFMGLDLMEIINRLKTAEGCEDIARLILPSEGRKIIKADMFFSEITAKTTYKKSEETEGSMSECWKAVDSVAFQNFKNLQSVKLKRQIDPLKIFLRKQNTRNYLLYRWVEHNIRSLKSIDRTTILSDQTKQILRKIKLNLPLWHMRQCIPNYLALLQKKIIHTEDMYNNASAFKKLNLEYWTNPLQMTHIYLYSYGRKGDALKQRFCCRYLVEKDNKGDRGWLLDEIDLKNCKFDSVKCCLQINEKNENRKLNGVAIVLVEKDWIQGPSILLPLYCKGKEYLKLEFSSKFKDDSGPWREGALGIIRAESQ